MNLQPDYAEWKYGLDKYTPDQPQRGAERPRRWKVLPYTVVRGTSASVSETQPVLVEFDKYFYRRVVLSDHRRRSFDTVTWVRFPPTGKGLRSVFRVCVCMQVCLGVCVWMSAWSWVFACVCWYVCDKSREREREWEPRWRCMCRCEFKCACVCVCECECVRDRVCRCVHECVYACVQACVSASVWLCMHARVCDESSERKSERENEGVGEAWVEAAHSGVVCATRSCALIQHIHTHTHKHTNHPRCLRVSASECCARATPLKHV